jgi:hypothetical protein
MGGLWSSLPSKPRLCALELEDRPVCSQQGDTNISFIVFN